MPRSAVFLLALAACTNEEKLAELEARQTELRSNYDETARQIRDMRDQLIAMGVISESDTPTRGKNTKIGGAGSKAKARVGNSMPAQNVTAEFPVAATRTGELPTLPPLVAAPERGESPCGWKFTIKDLADISDYNLNSLGLGRSGPVLLLADGQPLKPHATPAEYDESCSNAFRHAGWAILFSPESGPENAEKHTYSLALDPEIPSVRGEDNRPMYWVYPGTTVTLTAARAWDPGWGTLEVDLVLRRVDDGVPPKVSIGGQAAEVPDDKDAAHLHVAFDPIPAEPLVIEISAPSNGAYTVIETLTIGNADTAAVVTSEAAFKAPARKSP